MRRTVLALLALPLLALACGDDEPALPTSPLAIYAGEWNADKALTQGVLKREGNCLYVGESSPRLLVAFASSGTTWDAETETVTIPGGPAQSRRAGRARRQPGDHHDPVAPPAGFDLRPVEYLALRAPLSFHNG